MIVKQYREDYLGEFVITNTVYRNGKKEQTREWIDNPLAVISHSKRACCIAPDYNERKLPIERLEKHSGGLLGHQRMQLYAAGTLWKDIRADFSVIMEQDQLDEVIAEGFQVENVVYTSASRCIANSGEFYIIPLGTYYPPIVTTVWLACFDGHKDVFLYGYDPAILTEKVIQLIKEIMETFGGVQFHHVSDGAIPDAWMRCRNFRAIKTSEFITSCDI